jgi:hypothetical protein
MNEVKIPVIPREVAEAIEFFRKPIEGSPPYTNAQIIHIANGKIYTSSYEAALLSIPIDTLLAALVNGYTVEKSAEELAEEAEKVAHDKIRKRYEYLRSNAKGGNEHAQTAAEEIRDILDVLNVKITEVNA